MRHARGLFVTFVIAVIVLAVASPIAAAPEVPAGQMTWAVHAATYVDKISRVRSPTTCPCVQRKLTCSAGISPVGVRARGPVTSMAALRETETVKPIEKPSHGW